MSDMMSDVPFPKTQIGPYKISRLLCGSNSFFGYSHLSAARDRWIKRIMTVERIAEVLEKCAELDINGIVAGPQPKLVEALKRVEDKTGYHMYYLCTPSGLTKAEVLKYFL